MKIYLVRHGETEYGKKRYTTGHIDIPLNETGKQEAAATGRFLKDKNITKIFSSSLSRASETAKIIASELNLSVVEYDELMEHTSGNLDGIPIEEFFEKMNSVGDFEKMIRKAGGESQEVFRKRVWDKLLDIAEENNSRGDVIIVTHGVVIGSILAKIFGVPLLRNLSQANCCINIIDYNEEREGLFGVKLINHTYHLI